MVIDIPLSNGHLLNRQPRVRRGKASSTESDAIDSQNNAAGLATVPESNKSETEMSTTSPPSKRTPTRLPVLKVCTDTDRNGDEDGNSPSRRKGRDGSPEYEAPKALDQERERYWQRIRDKFDRDSLSPRNGAYRKFISLATSPRQEIAKHKLKYLGGSFSETSLVPAKDAATNTIIPAQRGDNSRKSTSPSQDRFSDGKRRMNSNHSASSNGSGASSQKYKTGSITNSSYNSNSSVSPISGPSSMKDWEDRFVVHMPSAREPNPPIMGVRQIAQYQKSIEQVQTEGGSMVDPETLPSPRSMSPEQHLKYPELGGKRLGTLDGEDSRPSSSREDADLSCSNNRYYCPDEIGKHRISTIWEESSTGPKQEPPHANADGSFLGCKEINGPHDRNPDEILYFSAPERPKVVDIPPLRITKVPKESKLGPTHQTKGASGESNLVQEEWEPISRNLKHAQCSKPSPKLLCREAQCQQLTTKKSTSPEEKEDSDSTEKQTGFSENRRSNIKADDVFIITPTITRTMVTMTDLRGHLPRQFGVREPVARSAGEIITDARTKFPASTKPGVSPSGLRKVNQNSWENSNASSVAPSGLAPTTNIPVVRFQEGAKVTATDMSTAGDKPKGMRGCIRTPGIPRSSTESRIEPAIDNPIKAVAPAPLIRKSHVQPRRSAPDNFLETRDSRQIIKPLPPSPPTRRSLSRLQSTIMQAKIVDVAELDGHQLDDHRETNNASVISSLSDHGEGGQNTQPDIKRIMSSETFHALIDMVFLFVAQVQGFCHQIKENRGSKVVLLKLFLNGIFGMLEHCLHVLKEGLAVMSAYNTTGAWPKTNDKNTALLLTDIGQALIYLAVLVLVGMVIARAVEFVVLVGTWIMWFARPFVLAFRATSTLVNV
ncbi:putative NTP binding protein [Aspergillus undulatus]|uniref:putative NTP binding protein n=1 Tax=Aspergillus undulatus TaxID=1810928 RepID=UPI003CCCEFE7